MTEPRDHSSQVRSPTPAYQPLRSQHVDVLLDKAGSLLTHSLDLRQALQGLGDLLVPQFADWCNVALLDEQADEWRLVLTRHRDPLLAQAKEQVETSFREWKNTGSFTQRVFASGEPLLVEEMSEQWLHGHVQEPLRSFTHALRVRSVLYLPLQLDGKLLGSLLLLVIDPERASYGRDDIAVAKRLATFVAAALRNAKLWGALQEELGERRRIERILRANTATIRTLAAGLGHDIGNLLQPLRLRLESLGTMTLPQMAVSDLKAINGVAGYFQRLTSGLRLLAGDPRAEIGSHDVTALSVWWEDVEALMKDALPAGVALHCDLPARLPPARIPPAALTHIIFNLVQNAGQGMQGRSHPTVRIWAERIPRQRALRFTVDDNGPGMDPETLRHCFDPFYSNVVRASTTRLGLPLVRALVERAGGQITARSQLGEGTSFVFTLPLSERRIRTRRISTLARVARVTVDDPEVRRAVSAVVQGSGFYVDETDGLLHGQAPVWITDLASHNSADDWLEFVLGGSNRLVILVQAAHVRPLHPRIHALPASDEDTALRAILASFKSDTPRPAPRARHAPA